ncbi:uncharacterized protein [Nicotiana tomentosiformis]|uniref:uncharacterized protein n=1 Tax=Nicotiana tomentosiformis TaxID=4098 RepID=UPI00388C5EB7
MGRTVLIASGLPKSFWAVAVNASCHLLNRCMVRPILKKTSYELLRGRKPNITHLRAFGCKCFMHNNDKEALEENIHVIFDESNNLAEKEEKTTLTASQTDEAIPNEPASLGHSLGEPYLGMQIRPWKHQSSHPLENVISDPNAEVQTRSSLRNLCALTIFLSQVEPKNIKEALKDRYWIIVIQEELNQFKRSKARILIVQVYVDGIIFGATNDAMCKEFAEMMGNEFEMSMMGELNFFLGLQIKKTPTGTMIH